MANFDRAALIEKLSDLEHEQWMEWSKAVAPDIKDPERIARWENQWVPYEQLDEKTKDMDREWAEEIMKIIEPLLGAQKAQEMITKVEYPALSAFLEGGSEQSSLMKVLAAGRAEAHCFTTWHEGLRKLEEAQEIFNNAMNMAASETLPRDMKAQLSSFVAEVYAMQANAEELFEELREVDPGAPPAPKDPEEEEEE